MATKKKPARKKGKKTTRKRKSVPENVTGHKPISAKLRKKTATIRQPNRKNGQKNRFPMPDVKHARLALQMLPKAKDLTDAEKAKIRRRAKRIINASKKRK